MIISIYKPRQFSFIAYFPFIIWFKFIFSTLTFVFLKTPSINTLNNHCNTIHLCLIPISKPLSQFSIHSYTHFNINIKTLPHHIYKFTIYSIIFIFPVYKCTFSDPLLILWYYPPPSIYVFLHISNNHDTQNYLILSLFLHILLYKPSNFLFFKFPLAFFRSSSVIPLCSLWTFWCTTPKPTM